jgi:hypothetical protein
MAPTGSSGLSATEKAGPTPDKCRGHSDWKNAISFGDARQRSDARSRPERFQNAAREAAQAIALIWSRTLGPEGLQAEAIGEDFMDAAVTFFERTEA